ncbi:MAG: 50S ribosomal protein L18 [Clostridium sp.]|jgi:large subunit ribosomal protein L18|nr:50S ribosomal protein L18 [Clostridium sp.]
MIKKPGKNVARLRKHTRVRKKIKGTSERPRLNVYRSLSNFYAQVIDDTTGKTLVAASSLDGSIKGKYKTCGNKEVAREVGKLLGQKAIKEGIKKVVFDRSGYLYHGRVKEFADGAREAGLEF